MSASIVGVDVGGTFTDLIVMEPATGDVRIAKVPTTADNQAFGVLAALESGGVSLADTATINHGTTTTVPASARSRAASSARARATRRPE